jgi:5-methyltetrahydrofolate--homocysteine methyltransferase
MGTMLQSLGYSPGESPEEWGLENKDRLVEVHRSYISAGADIILTNTFGGNRPKLAKYGLDSVVADLNKQLAEIAAEVSGTTERDVYVAGDVGPTGEFMKPIGLLTEPQMITIFCEQIRSLVEGGIDLVFIETMMDPNEAAAAVKAAKDSCDLPVFVSMTYNVDKNGFRTMMGTSPEAAAEVLIDAGADVIGANCGEVLVSSAPDLIRQLKNAGVKWVVVEPNAGVPQIVDGKTVFSQTPEEMADGVLSMIEAGANVIGGCCGTTPEHIGKITQTVKKRH